MDSSKRKITIKVFISYMALGLLMTTAGWFVFSEINAFTKIQEDDIADKNKIIKIGNILTHLYENESFGRAAMQSGSKQVFNNYLSKNDSLRLEIDSLKLLVKNDYQNELLDSVKILLDIKERNIKELKAIKLRNTSEESLENAIGKLTNIESSLGRLSIESFTKNPDKLDPKVRKTVEEYVTILNKYRPRDSSNTISEETIDSIVVSSKALLKKIRSDASKEKSKLLQKENQLIKNDLTVSQQLRKLLSALENEMLTYSKSINSQREQALKKSLSIITMALVLGAILVIIFSMMILNDFWQSQRYRKQLEMANSYTSSLLQSREQLISMVSHDLRTPLSTIVGYTELLKNTSQSNKESYYIDQIKNASGYVTQLVEDLLDYSKLEAGKIVIEQIPFDIATLIKETATSVQSVYGDKNVELIIETDKKIDAPIIGDPFRIRQILYNLIGNAYKFTDTGFIKIKTALKDTEILISVEDTGIGIKKEKQKIIFREFTQAEGIIEKKYGGFGLGLTISKKLASLLRGSLSLESEENKGSIFTLGLPVKFADAELIKPTNNAPFTAKKLKAIIVDDDTSLLNLIKEVLVTQKIGVITFGNGADALKEIGSLEYDLIITDIQLPKMNGFHFVELLKSGDHKYDNQPIIAVTGRKDLLRKNYVESGFSDVIFKPFLPNTLLMCLQGLFPDQEIKFSEGPSKRKEYKNFNLDALRSFLDNDDDLVKNTLSLFLQDTKNNLKEIKKGMGANDIIRIKNISHKMLTMFKQIEAKKVIPFLEYLDSLQQDHAQSLGPVYTHLEKNVEEVMDEMEELVN